MSVLREERGPGRIVGQLQRLVFRRERPGERLPNLAYLKNTHNVDFPLDQRW